MDDSGNDGGAQPLGVLPSRTRHEAAASDRLDPMDVLDRIADLDVRTWRESRDESGDVAHLGPAAEDFYDAFELGADPDRIAAGDPDGVALAAIQGVQERLREQADRIEEQRRSLERYRRTIADQRADIEALRQHLESVQTEFARYRAQDGTGYEPFEATTGEASSETGDGTGDETSDDS